MDSLILLGLHSKRMKPEFGVTKKTWTCIKKNLNSALIPAATTYGRHEGGRARHRGWAHWNCRGVVGRCATGCPRSTRATRAPRAYSTARLASLRDSQVGPRRSRHTRRADKPTCTPTNNTTAVPARPRDCVRGLLRVERLCGRSIVWR